MNQVSFFSARPVKETPAPGGGSTGLLSRAPKLNGATKTLGGTNGSSGARFNSRMNHVEQNGTKPVPRYEPIRKAAVDRAPVTKIETKTGAKKAFMPEFIKTQTQSNLSTQNGRYTPLSRNSQPVPPFQVRSGLPGQTHNQPSPFDRINRDRSSHLRKTQSNHRKESPTHSPIRSSDSYSRISPNRRSPTPNASFGRNSPISRQSPLSPLANNDRENEIDQNKEIDPIQAVEIASKLVKRFIDGDTIALERLTFQSLPRNSQLSVIQYILSTASKEWLEGSLDQWVVVLKRWCTPDIALESIKSWLDDQSEDTGNHTAEIITQIAIINYIDPSHDFEELFRNGRFHPLFFIILSKLLSAKGIIFIQKHFGNFDLLGMMNNRDRTELRLLLHQHKLLFLRPKYREEHLIEEDKDLEPKEIYRSIKGRCSKDREFGNSAGAMINLMWEDRIDSKKNMAILKKLLVGKLDAQVECLKVVVNAHIERALPKGALLKQFYDLYHDDVIDEDSFLRWEADIHDQTPQRADALKDVERFFVWLRSAEEESDDEKENQETPDQNHSELFHHESKNNDETTNGYINGNSESRS